MKRKRTVIIGDASIINEFRGLCKRKGMIPSVVVMGMIRDYLLINGGKVSGKKSK